MAVDGRQWLPDDRLHDPMAMAIAEIVHLEAVLEGRCDRYPIDQRRALRVRQSLYIDDAPLLMVIECGTRLFGQYLALTDRAVLYGRAPFRRQSRVTYSDLTHTRLHGPETQLLWVAKGSGWAQWPLTGSKVDSAAVIALLEKIKSKVAELEPHVLATSDQRRPSSG